MSRVGKGVASEGKGASSQKESEIDLELMMEKFIQQFNTLFDKYERRFEECYTGLEQSRSAGLAGVQEGVFEETSTKRHVVSKDGVIQDTP